MCQHRSDKCTQFFQTLSTHGQTMIQQWSDAYSTRVQIGGPQMVGLGNGWFASGPQGRNRLIGNKWRRSYSDRRSAWTATRRESHMVPIEMFHVSSNLQVNRLKRDHELGSPEKHGTQHRLNETSWETTELHQSNNKTQFYETFFSKWREMAGSVRIILVSKNKGKQHFDE